MTQNYQYHNSSPRAAFSMIEVVLSTLLVGVVLVTALNAVSGSIKTWEATDDDLERHALAHDLISEVIAKSYTDPDDPNTMVFGTDSGESGSDRTEFDDLDDFDDWTESPLEDPNGITVPGTTGWSRVVNVQKLNKANPTLAIPDGSADEGVRRITVTVIDADGDSTTLRAIRTVDGSMQQALGSDTTVVAEINVQITVGGQAPTTHGTNILNHAQIP